MTSETNKSFISKKIEDLPELVTQLREELKHPILLFIGELGAGKTTLIKELVGQLGSIDKGSSPSYSLINEYAIPGGQLFHLDLYRLNSAQEAFALGLEETLYSGAYCLIEWPQLIMDYLEPPYHIVKIEVTNSGQRAVQLTEIS